MSAPAGVPGAGRAAEFFAGMGLVRRALEAGDPQDRWETVLANDLSARKCRLYRASFSDADAVLREGDIRTLTPADLPAAELWTASFPCTDLSLAGRGAGIHAGQSGTVWALLDLLRETPGSQRPRRVLFENVPALLTSQGGDDLRALATGLNRLGYGVEPLVVNAAWFTAQSRARLFLIASHFDDAAAPREVRADAFTAHTARPEPLRRAVGAMSDVRWQARELPEVPTRQASLAQVYDEVPGGDSRWWPEARAAYFFGQIHPGHAALAERLIGGARVERRPAFRRVRTIGGTKRSVIELRDDGLAGCLRTPKGGSAKQIVLEAGRGERRVRFMTSTEAARLQGLDAPLPAGFSETELLYALGDAVCIPAVRWVLDVMRQDDAGSEAPATMAAVAEQPSRSAPAASIARASS